MMMMSLKKTPSTECMGPGCTRKAKVRGMCDSHYRQWHRGGGAPLKPLEPRRPAKRRATVRLEADDVAKLDAKAQAQGTSRYQALADAVKAGLKKG